MNAFLKRNIVACHLVSNTGLVLFINVTVFNPRHKILRDGDDYLDCMVEKESRLRDSGSFSFSGPICKMITVDLSVLVGEQTVIHVKQLA